MLKVALYTLLSLGGVTATTLTGVAISGGFSKKVVTIDPKYRVYSWDCYKWIIDRKTRGEVWACYDMRKEQPNRSLIFVLWWLPSNKGDGYNTFTEIDQIQLESNNSLSFKFTSGGDKYSSRKLAQPSGLYWKDVSKFQKQDPLEWSKITGKDLKSQCKLEGKEIICGDFRAAQEKLETKAWFRLIY